MRKIHINKPGMMYTLIHSKEDGEIRLSFMDAETSGISNEQLLEVLINRMSVLYGKLPDDYTLEAIRHCVQALMNLDERTEDRREKGILGMSEAIEKTPNNPQKNVVVSNSTNYLNAKAEPKATTRATTKDIDSEALIAINSFGKFTKADRVSFKIGNNVLAGIVMGEGVEEGTYIVKSKDVEYSISSNKLTKQ